MHGLVEKKSGPRIRASHCLYMCPERFSDFRLEHLGRSLALGQISPAIACHGYAADASARWRRIVDARLGGVDSSSGHLRLRKVVLVVRGAELGSGDVEALVCGWMDLDGRTCRRRRLQQGILALPGVGDALEPYWRCWSAMPSSSGVCDRARIATQVCQSALGIADLVARPVEEVGSQLVPSQWARSLKQEQSGHRGEH